MTSTLRLDSQGICQCRRCKSDRKEKDELERNKRRDRNKLNSAQWAGGGGSVFLGIATMGISNAFGE